MNEEMLKLIVKVNRQTDHEKNKCIQYSVINITNTGV